MLYYILVVKSGLKEMTMLSTTAYSLGLLAHEKCYLTYRSCYLIARVRKVGILAMSLYLSFLLEKATLHTDYAPPQHSYSTSKC